MTLKVITFWHFLVEVEETSATKDKNCLNCLKIVDIDLALWITENVILNVFELKLMLTI